MADTKFTMLGMNSSGKTSYLASMYKMMRAGLLGYTIIADDNIDTKFNILADSSADNTNINEMNTADIVSKYNFELEYAYKPLLSFEWADYPGSILADKNNSENYKTLEQTVRESSCLYICIDGKLLTGNDTQEKISRIRDSWIPTINSFLSKYLRNNNVLPPIAILATKYDLFKNDTSNSELYKIIKECFNPLFVEDQYNCRVVAIIPISSTIETRDNSDIEESNLHLPILMGIWFAQNKVQAEKDHEIAKCQRASKHKEYSEYEVRMSYLRRVMTEHSDNLCKELDKISLLYVNGRKKGMIDSFANFVQDKSIFSDRIGDLNEKVNEIKQAGLDWMDSLLMSNFSYLKDEKEFASFADACIATENILEKDPNASIVQARRALELAVEWVYRYDSRFNKNLLNEKEHKLFILLNDDRFKNFIGEKMSAKLDYVRKNGNKSVHGNTAISKQDAVQTLEHLFDFVQWIDMTYGKNYKSRTFSEGSIPTETSSFLKFAGGVAGGVVLTVGTLLASTLLDNKKS